MGKKISVGDKFDYDFSFTNEDVILFSKATGDFNPIHLDSEYAKNTIFKKPIVHGFLGGSVFSKVFGTLFPGNGTIYLKQDLSFFKPMYRLEKYKATFEIMTTNVNKNRALVKTLIIDNKNEIIINGEALIQHPLIF